MVANRHRHPTTRLPHSYAKRIGGVASLATLLCLPLLLLPHPASAQTIPPTQTTALDNHPVTLPHDLTNPATVLILGFGRHSADATTAWEKPIRQHLAQPGSVGFYDMAMLAEVPGFIRPLVLHAIRREVPDALKPNFLPLTGMEDAWKQAAGFTAGESEAAYILLIDRTGHIQWTTHAAFSSAGFAELDRRARTLAMESR